MRRSAPGVATSHCGVKHCKHKRRPEKGFSRTELARTIALCRPCHSAVHRAESESSLAESWNTLERLREHDQVARFAAWASGQRDMTRHRADTWHKANNLGLHNRQ